jgi:hypothetical protein
MEASFVLLFFRALAASSRDSFGDFVWFSFWQDDVIISTREWSHKIESVALQVFTF